ncbi:hypothetical protein Btru_012698 [Bulinus truncatus]|nr:hypothetical protein Btru_012698 [Bulinus truncatus]
MSELHRDRVFHILSFLVFVLIANGLSDICPDVCTCWETHVDCFGRQLVSIPEDLPMSVKKLEIQKNDIIDVNGEELAKLQNLESLYLKDNQIVEIRPQTFANISTLETIDLSCNEIKYIHTDGFFNLSSLLTVDLSDNQISDLSEQFESVPSLQRLILNSNKLSSLNGNSFSHLKNLTYLTLSNNQISIISQSAFEGMEKLSYLMLSGNPLRNVNNILHSLQALTFLDISQCQLTMFPTGLPWSVRFLNISNNYLNTVGKSLESIQHINVIDFDNNMIVYVQNDTFSKAAYLREIRISGNKLSYLPFKIPSSVEKFSADRNKIQRIFNNNFADDSKMLTLSLSSNNISRLEAYTFSRLKSLTNLSLAMNQIAELRSFTFVGLRQLTSLNLEHNPLTKIEDRAFSSLFRVQTLKMSNINSNATEMSSNVFRDLSALRNLDIEASPSVVGILFKSEIMLRSLHGLSQLNLKNNELKTLSTDVKNSLFSLEQIQLSGNQWECDDKLVDLKNWVAESPKIFLDTINCSSPDNLQGRSITEIDLKEFTASTVSTITEKYAYNGTDNKHQADKEKNVTENGGQNVNETKIFDNREQPATETNVTGTISITPSDTAIGDSVTCNNEISPIQTFYSALHMTTLSSLYEKTIHHEESNAQSQELSTPPPAIPTLTPVIWTPTPVLLTPTSVMLTPTSVILTPTSVMLTPTSVMLTPMLSSYTNTYDLQSSSDEFSRLEFSDSQLWASFTDAELISLEQTSLHESMPIASDSTYTFLENGKVPHSFNSRGRNSGDNRLPTFSSAAGSRMQVTIIGVAVSLLVFIAALLTAVAVLRCRQKRKRLILNDTASGNETSDTVFIIQHMADDHATEPDKESSTAHGQKSSSSSSSSIASKRGPRYNRQQSSTSSSSRTSFDCVRGTKDDDSEMLVYSWK